MELSQPFLRLADAWIRERSGAGREFLGWVHMASEWDPGELKRLLDAGQRLREQSEVVVVVGIGGSYLGTRAAASVLSHSFADLEPPARGRPRLVYAGHNMSGTYLQELLEGLSGRDVSVIVASKSGTTTEPALAFRALREYLQERYGDREAARRIVAVTDAQKGALRSLAATSGYETFVIPDDVGGRFSVLTPIGLLPLAASGVSVEGLLAGAAQAERELLGAAPEENDAYQYALLRHILRQKGKQVELFVSYEPGLHYVGEWWKQLFGESEGKDHKGLMPMSADFSTDLHSLGQYVQDGARLLFETVVKVAHPRKSMTVRELPGNADGLNYLAGKTLRDVNDTALDATVLAHEAGGVPNITLELASMEPEAVGYLFYFFELACAASAYLLGVNPFDQPGVEAYKENMFALLGKPGYESRRAELLAMRTGARGRQGSERL